MRRRDELGARRKERPAPTQSGVPSQRGASEEVPLHREREKQPQPVGERCSPLCPLFWCEKRAYTLRRSREGLRVFCTWIGDECIGPSCQYATCKGHYMLLPEGLCGWVKQRAAAVARAKDFFEEVGEDLLDKRAKELLQRRGGKVQGLE